GGIYTHDPSYAAFFDQREQELREIEVRRQREIMARATQGSIGGALQENSIQLHTSQRGGGGGLPQSPGTSTPADPGPAPSPGVLPGETGTVDAGDLTNIKRMLVEAQFGYVVGLEDGKESTFKAAFSSSWGNRKISQIASTLFQKQKITEPKRKDEKISELWKYYQNLA
ncbi:unnamed protein product, partial [Prorocentrum cordatum]